MAAASLGVASPNRMEPNTAMISANKGTKALSTSRALSHTPYSTRSLGLGHSDGLMTARVIT